VVALSADVERLAAAYVSAADAAPQEERVHLLAQVEKEPVSFGAV
jgi:hypothetical protein